MTSTDVFSSLGSDDLADNLTCVESLCLSCYKQGMTRLLLTRIPHYKEVVVSSFSCAECHWANTEIQSCGPLQDRGVRFEVTVSSPSDLNRQVVKAEYATISIPCVSLEIPPESQKGSISTIEGILQRVQDGLNQEQPDRKLTDPSAAEQVDQFIEKLKSLTTNPSFTFILDDPSGNSFVENPNAPNKDDKLLINHYIRTLEQDNIIGISPENKPDAHEISEGGEDSTEVDFLNEVVTFKGNCSNCSSVCDTNMKQVKIPYFKEVIIMATNCDNCGLRSDEVKSGVGIEPQGSRLTLSLDPLHQQDLNRDVLKSETSMLEIPEIQFELGYGSLGGKFTTIEGLLVSIDEGIENLCPFLSGDSAASKEKLAKFREQFEKCKSLEIPFTLILDDPAGNSYISKLSDDDTRLKSEKYERNYEQNELLGINDMKTENYGENS